MCKDDVLVRVRRVETRKEQRWKFTFYQRLFGVSMPPSTPFKASEVWQTNLRFSSSLGQYVVDECAHTVRALRGGGVVSLHSAVPYAETSG